MTLPPVDAPPARRDEARLRSGTAARLAGLPVTTLRVWERRYGVVAAPKTPQGQRLYSAHDVQRLKLLKQLTERGHAIGTIATLAHEALERLFAGSEPPRLAAATVETSRRVVVVGRVVAQKLGAAGGHELQAVYDDLEHAAVQPLPAGGTDVLLVHLASLQPAVAERVLALGRRLQAGTLVVVYAFGAEAAAQSLRAAGATLRREPVDGREIAQLIGAAHDVPVPAPAAWQAAPRRFSDDALAALSDIPSRVACECPRHLAEMVTHLAGFERYSADCLTRSPADAALHRHLSGVAGVARTLFEEALERVVAEEGLSVPGRPGAVAGLSGA